MIDTVGNIFVRIMPIVSSHTTVVSIDNNCVWRKYSQHKCAYLQHLWHSGVSASNILNLMVSLVTLPVPRVFLHVSFCPTLHLQVRSDLNLVKL